MKKLKAIFMGTPDFAVPCLKAAMSCLDIIMVVTQPDKKRGRGQKITYSPIKEFALENNLPVFQPQKIKDEKSTQYIKDLNPDLIIVVAFGQILSQKILDIPPLGCVNVHASLLPRYRGAAPIHWSIINGEEKTGITTMYMDAGLDTGDMIYKKEVAIAPQMTTEQLHDVLMKEGADLLVTTIKAIEKGKAPRIKQNDNESSYSPMIKDNDCRIDWQKSAKDIYNMVRGLNSWPVAYTFLGDKKFKIWETEVISGTGKSGEIVSIQDGIIVGTGKDLIKIVKLQPPNKKAMLAKDFINGHKIELPIFFS